MREPTKYLLSEAQMPTVWNNLAVELDASPHLHPGTGQPVGEAELSGIFPREIVRQELSREVDIPIPEEVREIYTRWRPSPLVRAKGLERALQTPARIFFKYEGVSPSGSHKANTAVAQAYYNKQDGTRRLATETGAGQWGSSLAFASALFGLELKVFMVRASYGQKPYRRALMHTYGGVCVPSPSTETAAGRKILAQDPDCPGSLGIATSEALEVAMKEPGTRYAAGSVLNHVLLHQTIIGQEAILQLAMADVEADEVIGCVGGGSNFAGFAFPFLRQKLKRGGRGPRIVGVEPAACPSMTRGRLAYDFGDTTGLTPLVRMHTLGHAFIPPSLHAGGLRYHGVAPLISRALERGLVDAVAVPQIDCFEAGVMFARSEGIVPAPESTHAIAATVAEALRCREAGEARTIVFNLSGHGHFDMASYEKYLQGELEDATLDEKALAASLALVPQPHAPKVAVPA